MFVFIGDETNVRQDEKAKFFIYGGLIINLTEAPDICNKVYQIRTSKGYQRCDKLKFETHSRPQQVTIEDFSSCKDRVINMCSNCGVQFMAYVVHHHIAKKHRPETQWLWALKTLLCGYDLFLQRENEYGICLVDRFSNAFNVLREIHQSGVDPQFYGGRLKHQLDRIMCYGTVSIDTTHLASLVDIVLGAFRYCVNEITRDEISARLYKKVRPLMVCETGNPSIVEEWGLFLRPKTVVVAEYRTDYENLRKRLKSLE